jgi:hypothetical protein
MIMLMIGKVCEEVGLCESLHACNCPTEALAFEEEDNCMFQGVIKKIPEIDYPREKSRSENLMRSCPKC